MFARLTIVLTLLTTLVALLGGARYCLDALQHLRQHKKQTGRWLSILVLWAIPTIAEATTYWVSPTGAAAWGSCVGTTPLSGTAACPVQTAFDNALAGDVVNFRGGTYTVPQRNFGDSYTSYYMPANSGTSGNYITFQAYTGETPLFNGTSGGSGDVYGTNGTIGCKIMGVYHQQYIILDGFSFQCDSGVRMAGMTVGGNDELAPPYSTNYVTIRNCTINGGSNIHTGTDNADGIRLNSTGNVTIHGNTIYNFRESTDYPNTAATKAYHTQYVTYENNVIYTSTTGIYDKSGGDHNIFRYNYIHNVTLGLHIVMNSYPQTNGQIYHNILAFIGDTAIEQESESGGGFPTSHDWIVYNNTVYSTSAAATNPVKLYTQDSGLSPYNYSFYNNIVQQAGLDYGGANVRTNLDPTAGLVTLDYNNYGSAISVRLVTGGTGGSGNNYTSIASLRAVAAYNLAIGAHDMHSIASSPIFANASGTMSTVADFALTPASPGYRAGNDGADMGANVSLVGPTTTSVSESLAFFLRGLSWIHWGLTVGGGAFQGLMTCLYLWRRRSKIAWGMLRCWQVTVALPKVLFWRARYRRAVRRWQQAAPCMVTYQGMTLVGERKDGVWQHWSN